MKTIAVIPARLNSSRFPNKVLLDICGLPMVEHVRRRALLCPHISDVFVATCDHEVVEVVQGYGGQVLTTSDSHINGTSRVAEAVADIDASHVILLQGDEPLLIPRHISSLALAIRDNPEVTSWNLTSPIESPHELEASSIVKCVVTPEHQVVNCFRTPINSRTSTEDFSLVRKMLGILAFRISFLQTLSTLPASSLELSQSIEQFRILEHGFCLYHLDVTPSTPSINVPDDLPIVLDALQNDAEQLSLLHTIRS